MSFMTGVTKIWLLRQNVRRSELKQPKLLIALMFHDFVAFKISKTDR